MNSYGTILVLSYELVLNMENKITNYNTEILSEWLNWRRKILQNKFFQKLKKTLFHFVNFEILLKKNITYNL